MQLPARARPPILATILAILAFGPLLTPSRPAAAQTKVCGPMDVAFIIDDTGSMGGAINNVKAGLAAILGDIATASAGDYRLSLVTFKDNITIHDNFAAGNAAAVGPDILGLTASGGGGEPEASDESLNTVINALPAAGRPQNVDFTPAYRSGALKIAILVTDARPGGFDSTYTPGVDDVNAHTRALEAAAQSIKISAVHVPGGFDSTVTTIMQDYATTTGGVYTKTNPDGTGTGQAIKDIIEKCGSGDGPDLTITKTPKPGQPDPVPGGYFSYIIRVKNIGNRPTPPPPTDVTLRDDLSSAGTFVFWTANSGRCTNNAPYVDCSRGTMAPGEEWWVEIRVRIPNNACTISNKAVVDRFNRIAEVNEFNNTASLVTGLTSPGCVVP